MGTPVESAAQRLREGLAWAGEGLVEREALIETIALSAVATEHVLVIGPPGTAKSHAVRRVARAIGGHYFEYLLGRFTEPTEVFGPIDLRRLRDGVVHTETAGMLPEAEVAFLDEVFRGSTAILNTLLGILNERVFRRGHTQQSCPLRVCVGAANDLPSDDSLAAFADRFLVRVFLDSVPDPLLEDLMEGGWSLDDGAPPREHATLSDLDVLAAAAREADLGPVRPHLAHAIRLLRSAGLHLTDRRVVKVQRLVAAAAVMAGRSQPTEADLWPLVVAIPTREEQATGREVLHDVLAPSHNPVLPAATEEASLGRIARATRLAVVTRATLAARPSTSEAEVDWRLRLEAIAREIDATLGTDLPEDLAAARRELVLALGTGDDQ